MIYQIQQKASELLNAFLKDFSGHMFCHYAAVVLPQPDKEAIFAIDTVGEIAAHCLQQQSPDTKFMFAEVLVQQIYRYVIRKLGSELVSTELARFKSNYRKKLCTFLLEDSAYHGKVVGSLEKGTTLKLIKECDTGAFQECLEEFCRTACNSTPIFSSGVVSRQIYDYFMNFAQFFPPGEYKDSFRQLKAEGHELQADLLLMKELACLKKREELKELLGLEEVPFLKLELLQRGDISYPSVILVSGFTSQNHNKQELWRNMIMALPDRQIFAVTFQSSTLVRTILDVAASVVKFLRYYSPFEAFKDGQYNKSLAQATRVGRALGLLLPKLFQERKVELIGFSMGTHLITMMLQSLASIKAESLVERVILMGGVASVAELGKVVPQYRNKIFNFWSKKDYVLPFTWLYAGFTFENIGLCAFEQVANFDMSNEVTGHLNYAQHFPAIYKLVETSQNQH